MEEKVLKELHLSIKLGILILAIVFSASGCQSSKMVQVVQAKGVPANAILISDGLYMVPVGKDGTGCQMYRPFSPNHYVVASIFYKSSDGKFVIDKGKSDCK